MLSQGDVIGGIIGTDIVRYDIYGKDVLIANKMESNGTIGRIMVSAKTKELLENKFPQYYLFEHSKNVFIKTINENIDGFFISERVEDEEQDSQEDEKEDESNL